MEKSCIIYKIYYIAMILRCIIFVCNVLIYSTLCIFLIKYKVNVYNVHVWHSD